MVTSISRFSSKLLVKFARLFAKVTAVIKAFYFVLSMGMSVAFIIILVAPMSFFMTGFVTGEAFHVFHLRSRVHKRRAKLVSRVVKGRGIIRTFKHKRSTARHFSRIGGELRRTSLQMAFFSSVAGPTAEFIGDLICAKIKVAKTFTIMHNTVDMKRLSDFLDCTGRCAGPFGRVSKIIARFRGTVTYTREMFALVSRRPRVPRPRRTIRLVSVSKGIGMRSISFSCLPNRRLVRSFGLRMGPKRHVTVIKPAKYKGAALVGLLVHFCSMGTKGVGMRSVSVHRVAEGDLHTKCKVILRRA